MCHISVTNHNCECPETAKIKMSSEMDSFRETDTLCSAVVYWKVLCWPTTIVIQIWVIGFTKRRLVSFVLMRGLFRNTPFAVTNWLRGVEWTERVETNQYAHILIIFSSCSNKITIRQKLKIKKLPVTLQLNIFFKNILHNFSFEAFMKLKL
jgi:hypothetical protein